MGILFGGEKCHGHGECAFANGVQSLTIAEVVHPCGIDPHPGVGAVWLSRPVPYSCASLMAGAAVTL